VSQAFCGDLSAESAFSDGKRVGADIDVVVIVNVGVNVGVIVLVWTWT
jgi:hypothetical protein